MTHGPDGSQGGLLLWVAVSLSCGTYTAPNKVRYPCPTPRRSAGLRGDTIATAKAPVPKNRKGGRVSPAPRGDSPLNRSGESNPRIGSGDGDCCPESPEVIERLFDVIPENVETERAALFVSEPEGHAGEVVRTFCRIGIDFCLYFRGVVEGNSRGHWKPLSADVSAVADWNVVSIPPRIRCVTCHAPRAPRSTGLRLCLRELEAPATTEKNKPNKRSPVGGRANTRSFDGGGRGQYLHHHGPPP